MQQGKLGSIQQVMGFQLSSPQRRLPTWYEELPGGLFFDEAPHLLYLIRHFLGDLKIDFTAIRRDDSTGAIASLQAALCGASANAALTMTFSAPVSEWLLVVVGSKQVLVIDIFRDILVEANSDGSHSAQEILINSLRFGAGLGAGFVTSGFLHGTNHLFYGHDVLIRQFIRSIRDGKSPPVTGRDGAAVVAAMEALLAGGKRTESRVDSSNAA
jgi:predicted dehydrogenase